MIFATVTQWVPLDLLFWNSVRIMNVDPQDYIYMYSVCVCMCIYIHTHTYFKTGRGSYFA